MKETIEIINKYEDDDSIMYSLNRKLTSHHKFTRCDSTKSSKWLSKIRKSLYNEIKRNPSHFKFHWDNGANDFNATIDLDDLESMNADDAFQYFFSIYDSQKEDIVDDNEVFIVAFNGLDDDRKINFVSIYYIKRVNKVCISSSYNAKAKETVA